MSRLLAGGFEAYAVGGCVRDSLIEKIPHDWDIATSAHPEEISACFPGERVIPTGVKHGTVTVMFWGEPYEITTYRTDGRYSDGRRPDSVTFTHSIREDLARRDFTVNAMAADINGSVIDHFCGIEDLRDGLIRCVGKAEIRFDEDALRIFRCVRFAAALDFSIEEKTATAMVKLRQRLDFVARERIREELCAALMGDGFKRVFLGWPKIMLQIIPEFASTINFDQRTPYHHLDVWGHILTAVQLAEKDLTVRLAMLFHDIGKPMAFTVDEKGIGHFKGHEEKSSVLAETIMRRLRFPGDLISQVKILIRYHGVSLEPTERTALRWLNRLGEYTMRRLMQVKMADTLAHAPEHYEPRLKRNETFSRLMEQTIAAKACFSLSRLAVSGNDLIQAGYPEGSGIGKSLNMLLDKVVDSALENDKEVLIGYLLRVYPPPGK